MLLTDFLKKMQIPKEEKTRDGRIAIFLVIATGLTVFNLHFSKQFLYTPKTNNRGVNNLCFIEGSASDTSCCFEVLGLEKNIPNNLRPMYFLPVQINTASRELLVTIKGIGPSLAEKIITHRMQVGPFKTKNDFMELKGVGVKRAEHLLPFLDFDEVAWEAN